MDKKILESLNLGKRSVGPAAYKIKPTIGKDATDPTIEKNPAYSILGRRKHGTDAGGPGPTYNTFGFTEHGKHRTPGGVISRRPEPKKRDAFVTPGPADYFVKSIRTQIGYRMGHVGRATDDRWNSPAPNAYTLPDAPKGPKQSIAHRWKVPGNKCVTPGPGHYGNMPHPDLYLPGATRQGRTMGGRPKDQGDGCGPGPSSYDGDARVNCCARLRGVKDDYPKKPCHRYTMGRRWPESVGVFAVPQDNEYVC